jgi:conjugative transfer pilus assembly protein TraH
MKTLLNKAISLAVCASLLMVSPPMISPAKAGFMEDFFNSAGAMSNVTNAQIYSTATSDVLSGGSLVFKSPQRTFTPFGFTPPSLKAGCGGIDMYMGAFGMANKQEFVQFLRNVGQNSAGLAFKVALQAMSPDLATQVQEIADTINEWNKYFGSSCEAAKRVMDSGPNAWIAETVGNAKRNLVATGAVAGETEARDMVETNGDAAISNAPSRQNDAGKTIESAQINIVWAAMNRGTLSGLTDDEKEIMMSLFGTTILRKIGSGDSATLEADTKLQPRFNISALVGNPTGPTGTFELYRCDQIDMCLNPFIKPDQMESFGQLFYKKSIALRDAIRNRTQPNLQDLRLLSMGTSLPLLKIIELRAATTNQTLLDDEMLEVWSTAAAWEIASQYVEEVAGNLQTMLKAARDSDTSALRAREVQKVVEDLNRTKDEMRGARAQIYSRVQQVGALISQLEHLERAMYSSVSTDLVANARFGK